MKSYSSQFILLVALGMQFHSIACGEESLQPDQIRCRPGFTVELLRSAQAGEDSWISMSFDDRGRIFLGLDNIGVARLTLSERDKTAKFDRLDNTLKHCRGVLWAHGSVYVDATNSQKIVRLRDDDGDDRYESQQTILNFDYRSRYGHGSNQLRLGPDGSIYVVVGNDCSFPSDTLESSPYRNPRNDWLLPNLRDAGHDNRVGYILKMDADGKQRQIIAGGFRNQVDAAFNRHGDMFTFDADMEWDIGAPWYRPIRVNHIVSGGEYGWRWGTGKWPAYYPDSLPSNLDVGLGSPTGVVFGTTAKFPAKYQEALFLGDWQNGRILAAHPQLAGGSYAFQYESFLDGAPLNVCDLEFGADGNLYFITGGRGSQSALYRVSWSGGTPQESPVELLNELHILRRKLETLHSAANPQAVATAWPHLGHDDPWVRHAARVAIERQALSQWESRVYVEQNVETLLNGLIALCRMKETNESNRDVFVRSVVKKLSQVETSEPRQLIAICRVYALLFARHGPATDDSLASVRGHLETQFPNSRESVNRELCELLVYAKSDTVLPLSLKLLTSPTSQETQVEIARLIRNVPKAMWNEGYSRQYLEWLGRARHFRGGRLLPAEILHLQTGFVAALAESEKRVFATELAALSSPVEDNVVSVSRELVQQWDLVDLEDLTDGKQRGDAENGRRIFVQAQCSRCHRMGDLGGQIGPDLTVLGRRFDRRAMLEAIVQPSKVIDAKYAQATYVLATGKSVTGRVAHVNRDRMSIEIDPLAQTTIEILRSEIESTSSAKTSPMPTGLVNYFSKKEIGDLLEFLRVEK